MQTAFIKVETTCLIVHEKETDHFIAHKEQRFIWQEALSKIETMQ